MKFIHDLAASKPIFAESIVPAADKVGTGEAPIEAPRTNAGKAFIDFFLEEESMKIQADTGEFVNRRGVYPPLQDADKIKFVQMYQFGKEDYEKKKKEYQMIFLQ